MVNFRDGEEVPFNFAMLFYEEIHKLRMMKSEAFINGELVAYRDCLEEILATISFQLSTNEAEEVRVLFRDAHVLLMSGNPMAKSMLREADLKLMVLMNRYKMIFPGAKKGGLSLVEKKYGLSTEKNKGGRPKKNPEAKE